MRSTRTATLCCSTLLALLAWTGCGDDAMPDHDHDGEHDHAADGSTEHDHTSCGLTKNCTGTVDLKTGLKVQSEKKKFSVEVVSASPLSVSSNDIVLKVTDAGGKQVKDAKIVQDVFSADCMHGGPLPPQDIKASSDGTYEIKPFHEHMGPWDTTLEITAGGVTDMATFHFCVPEEGDAG